MFFKEIFQIFKHEFHQVVLGLYFLTSGKLTLLKMSLKRSKDLNFYLAQVTLEFQPFNNVFLFNHTFLLSQESFVSSQKNIKMNWETDMSIIPEELYSSLSVNCIFNVFLKNLDLEDELDDFIFLPWDLIFKRVWEICPSCYRSKHSSLLNQLCMLTACYANMWKWVVWRQFDLSERLER